MKLFFFFFFTGVTTPLKVFFYSNCIIHSFQYVIKKKKRIFKRPEPQHRCYKTK